MYEQLLTQTGLSYTEAVIYELLLKEGELSAGMIHKKTPLKRGLIYKALDDLIKKGLVKKDDQAEKVARFTARHPSELAQFINKKEEDIRRQKGVIDTVLPRLVSDYTLSSGRPGVRFYEGLDGLRLLMDDTLTASGPIYAYADVEAVQKYIKTINENYVRRREKLKKTKKILVMNSEFNRDYFRRLGPAVTDVSFLDFNFQMLGTVMNIYDDKVSYSTLKPQTMIGVMIEDPNIAAMQRSLFEYNWQHAQSVPQAARGSSAAAAGRGSKAT